MSETRKILVVDDQHEILDVTAAVLGQAGFEVVTSKSGFEGLRRLAVETFDLLLLDINMPEIDGWEVLRLVRADDALAELPVVMFSVKGEVHDKILGLQEGAVDYITKPFVVDDLVDRVRRVFDEAKA